MVQSVEDYAILMLTPGVSPLTVVREAFDQSGILVA
jgi:hypothetical protein